MDTLRAMLRYLWIGLAIGVLYNVWIFSSRHNWWRSTAADKDSSYITVPQDLGGKVRIVQFYAREGVVTEGAGTVICYGVLNAKQVTLQPPVGSVWPSVNRCIDIHPARDTSYTLTAEGTDGTKVAESFNVQVAADVALLPKITSFRVVSCQKGYDGEPLFKVSFADQNGEEISVDPPVIPTLHGSPMGEFYATPSRGKTYTLTVKGKSGHVATRTLTVDEASCK